MCAPPRASIPPLSPAGRAPGPPFTPATSRVKETFSQISGMRGSAQPFFSTGSEASSYLTEIKDESALLNKLRALSAKYLGSDLASRTPPGSQRMRPISKDRPSAVPGFWFGSGGRASLLLLASQLGFGRLPNMPTSHLHQGQLTCNILTICQHQIHSM